MEQNSGEAVFWAVALVGVWFELVRYWVVRQEEKRAQAEKGRIR